jgi:DNA-directed RNA polymerase subunit RPC12/RpoP
LGAKKAFEHKRKKWESDGVRNPEDSRKECEHCGRRFNEEFFEKHNVVCEKVFIKRRKPFNSLE